jgi:hypothetical protein
VNDAAGDVTAPGDGVVERRHREPGLHPRVDRVAHDPVGVDVLDGTQVELALIGAVLGDVGQPQLVRCCSKTAEKERPVLTDVMPVVTAHPTKQRSRALDVAEQEGDPSPAGATAPARHDSDGNQNSSWMLSGSRKTMTDPSGVSAAGVKVTPRCSSSLSHARSWSTLATENAK